MPKLIAALLILAMLQGCVSRQVLTLQSLALPRGEHGPCCWQATQEVGIHYNREQYHMVAVVAFTENGFSLVLLGPLGQRMFSVQEAQGRLNTFRSPNLPEEFPQHLLLALHYLSWWPENTWKLIAPWRVERQGLLTAVSYDHKTIVTITHHLNMPQSHQSHIGEQVIIQHQLLNFTMTITTRQWQAL